MNVRRMGVFVRNWLLIWIFCDICETFFTDFLLIIKIRTDILFTVFSSLLALFFQKSNTGNALLNRLYEHVSRVVRGFLTVFYAPVSP